MMRSERVISEWTRPGIGPVSLLTVQKPNARVIHTLR